MSAKLYLVGHREVEHRICTRDGSIREGLEHPIDYYKIGIAEDVDRRLATLSTGTPHELELVTTVECDRPNDVEDRLHSINRYHHKHGEWYYLPRNMVNSLIALDRITLENLRAVSRIRLQEPFEPRISLYIQLMGVRNGEFESEGEWHNMNQHA